MENVFIQMMYKSHFQKIYSYDWFYGSGSRVFLMLHMFSSYSSVLLEPESHVQLCVMMKMCECQLFSAGRLRAQDLLQYELQALRL